MIDAHHHLWKYNPTDYVWMDDRMENLKHDYLPDNLLPQLHNADVSQTVVVQARQTLDETHWLLDMADRHSFIAGVVGWVDLRSATLDKQLRQLSRHPKFKGVRHVVHDEPNDQFMALPDFQRGISTLAGYGLSYDLLIYPKHLPLAYKLAEKFPRVTFIIDHIAKPDIKNQIIEPWATEIRHIADLPNVYCKLSGMVTEASWKSWRPQDFYPYLSVLWDAFGAERLMTGSDWPVCTLAGNYLNVMRIVPDFLSYLSSTPQQRSAVLSGTARRIYQFDKT